MGGGDERADHRRRQSRKLRVAAGLQHDAYEVDVPRQQLHRDRRFRRADQLPRDLSDERRVPLSDAPEAVDGMTARDREIRARNEDPRPRQLVPIDAVREVHHPRIRIAQAGHAGHPPLDQRAAAVRELPQERPQITQPAQFARAVAQSGRVPAQMNVAVDEPREQGESGHVEDAYRIRQLGERIDRRDTTTLDHHHGVRDERVSLGVVSPTPHQGDGPPVRRFTQVPAPRPRRVDDDAGRQQQDDRRDRRPFEEGA